MGSKLRIFVAAILLAGLPAGAHAQELPDTPDVPEAEAATPPAQAAAPEGTPTSAPVVDPVDTAFNAFLQGIRGRAISEGVKPETFDRETSGLTPNPTVIRHDRRQPGASTSSTPGSMDFEPYRRQHVDRAHIDKGRARYQSLRPLLTRIEQKTGVSEAVAMAIFGHETGYGSFSGNFDLVRSLATLA